VLCILHGYLLEGSGSNLWTRSVVKTICDLGETVHLFCQENHPEDYDFISKAYLYERNGEGKILFDRETPHKGKCIVHKPKLGDTLPVYVWDKYEEFRNVVPMVELSTEELERYIGRNLGVLSKIVKEYDITHLFVNHAVLMSVVAERLHDSTSVQYSIAPHGSALTYAVEKDERLFDMAKSAFGKANSIFVTGEELRKRVLEIFPPELDLEPKLKFLNLGVDSKMFKPVKIEERNVYIHMLSERLQKLDSGKQLVKGAYESLDDGSEKNELIKLLGGMRDYDERLPDANLVEKLMKIDWKKDKILIFIGRLIANKGPQAIINAFPQILDKHPNARLVIVGHGPLREVLEMMVWALKSGQYELFKNIIKWGRELEGSTKGPFSEMQYFIDDLDKKGKLKSYFKGAKRHFQNDNIIFTGYLTHNEMKFLLPCTDIAIFPSLAPEAGPLVFLEALSCGIFPLGTYIGGMVQMIDEIKGYLFVRIPEMMKLRAEERYLVNDIIERTVKVLDMGIEFKDTLHRFVVENHDWKNVAQMILSCVKNG